MEEGKAYLPDPNKPMVLIPEDVYRKLLVQSLMMSKPKRNAKLSPKDKLAIEELIGLFRLPANCMLAIVGKSEPQEPAPMSSEEAPKLEVLSETPTTTEQDEPKNSS